MREIEPQIKRLIEAQSVSRMHTLQNELNISAHSINERDQVFRHTSKMPSADVGNTGPPTQRSNSAELNRQLPRADSKEESKVDSKHHPYSAKVANEKGAGTGAPLLEDDRHNTSYSFKPFPSQVGQSETRIKQAPVVVNLDLKNSRQMLHH